MASAFQDKSGYIADFRGYQMINKQRRRVRIPVRHLIGNAREAAAAFAAECDRYCRYLEVNPEDIDAILHAHKIGAITDEIKERLIGTAHYGLIGGPDEGLGIVDAALQHPSTIKDRTKAGKEYLKHRRYLDQFIQWARISFVHEITLAMVQEYVAQLVQAGYAWDTRKQKIMYIKRATRVGTIYGYADTLSGWRLDSNNQRPAIFYWTLDELLRMVESMRGDRNMLTAIYLGGFMGLRPSEMLRLQFSDIRDGVLYVGEEIAKNRFSRRALPLPQAIADCLAQAKSGPLIPNHSGAVYELDKFSRLWAIRGPRPHPSICANHLPHGASKPCLQDMSKSSLGTAAGSPAQ